jgi:hypothetical protein
MNLSGSAGINEKLGRVWSGTGYAAEQHEH